MTLISEPYARRRAPSSYDAGFFDFEHQNIQRALAGAQRAADPLKILTPEDFLAKGDRVTDDGAALQAWIDACSTDSDTTATPVGYFSGRYRSTRQLQFKKMYVRLLGAGMRNAEFYFDGLGAGVPYFTTSAMQYLRPFLSDFRVTNNASTGKCFDFSNITTQVYNGALERILIYSGAECIYAPRFFSMKMDTVWGSSTTGHSFRVSCGPSVPWINCYALACGPGKAGYRLTGNIALYSCNGLNSGDFWGVFGQDTAAADGFQNDFPDTGTDYPSVTMIGCNVEEFSTCGVRLHNSYINCDIIGGKIDRAGLTSAYHSLIHARLQPYGDTRPVRISARIFPGTGVPNGGLGLTEGWLMSGTGAYFQDVSGGLVASSITKYYDATAAVYYPLLVEKVANDVAGDTAFSMNALRPRRLTVQTLRYDKGAFTPVGANQTINVTGYTKVKVTPAAAASVDKATFTQTVGTGSDYQRNGPLEIEAGNGNLTINHNIAGEGGFRMKGAANVTLASGEIRTFSWSDNYTAGVAGWIET